MRLRKAGFVPMTTDSRHGWRVVPNLAGDLQLTDIDQLGVADITYVHLAEEFAYLAIVLDAYSRKVIGWAMVTHLNSELAIAALDQRAPTSAGAASSTRPMCNMPALNTLHDLQRIASNRAELDWQPLYDTRAERFMRTLKEEEVDGRAYRDIIDAKKKYRRIHRAGLQPASPAFSARLSLAG
ncbi:hypothetical protein [Mesorhizobium sp. M0203]|uniref:DDE-type integrase/transposase/recombinase n=1 Tax=Mesorhizobium sp. M0203 TaxID=2956912 RepID=UPI0033375EE3